MCCLAEVGALRARQRGGVGGEAGGGQPGRGRGRAAAGGQGALGGRAGATRADYCSRRNRRRTGHRQGRHHRAQGAPLFTFALTSSPHDLTGNGDECNSCRDRAGPWSGVIHIALWYSPLCRGCPALAHYVQRTACLGSLQCTCFTDATRCPGL